MTKLAPSKPSSNSSSSNGRDFDEEQEPLNLTMLSDSLSSTIASTASEMNNAMIMESDDSTLYASEPEPVIAAPSVDRSQKAKALLKMGSREASKKKMSDVLEAEKDLIEDTLQLEMKQLEMENRWEVFRLRKEKSAEEDMKLEVMKKEEALLDELQKMSEEKEKRDLENHKLREQLKAIKDLMERVSDDLVLNAFTWRS